uniref:Uncharacterized protein n=1 Tax=Encephalitozoon cuniculi TaxID=6035 RepID=M1K7F5_ENCCN|nr:hypothetical protein ECU08_0820 [Encephalitozoon cuniculi]
MHEAVERTLFLAIMYRRRPTRKEQAKERRSPKCPMFMRKYDTTIRRLIAGESTMVYGTFFEDSEDSRAGSKKTALNTNRTGYRTRNAGDGRESEKRASWLLGDACTM